VGLFPALKGRAKLMPSLRDDLPNTQLHNHRIDRECLSRQMLTALT